MTVAPAALDAATLEIVWGRLLTIADECWTTLRRTAFSPIITEALDIGCEVMDASGNTLSHASRGMPVFNLVLPNVTRHFLERFGAGWLEDGDVLITNDPWLCAGHLPDVAVVTPIFRRGELLGFVGNIANATDIGGTLARASAREVYEEGLRIPPMKLARRGVVNEDLLSVIRANVRQADSVIGDLHAQMTANVSAGQRLVEFADEYGIASLVDLGDTIRAYSERGMRAAIDAVPDGEYAASTLLDDAELHVLVRVHGDRIDVTYPDCPPQVAQGGTNVALNYTRAHTVYILKCILAPDIPSNQGAFRPITVSAEPGSILNAREPASVGLRTKTGWHVHPLILKALAPVLPDRVMAPCGFPSWLVISGYDRAGGEFREHMVLSGGLGATADRDGVSACGYPTTTAAVPVEVIETRSPLIVEAKEYVVGSGGPGRQRGGLSQRVVVRQLPGAGVRSVTLSASLDQSVAPADGLAGAGPGQRSAFVHDDGTGPRRLEVAYAVLGSDAESATLETAGGGGFGDPRERTAEAAERDRREGYIKEGG